MTAVLTAGGHAWVPQNRWDLVADERPAWPAEAVAVIIPYFEQPESLARMYAALALTQLGPAGCEVVIVDDGSAVPPPPPPDGFPFPVQVLHQSDRGCRPGAARNLGAAHTAADVLVFLDPDTLPEPTTIARLAAWPAVVPDALVVGRRRHADLRGWTPEATQGWLRGVAPAPVVGRDPAWLQHGYDASGDLLDVDDRSYRFVISAVMACHRWLYDDIGGFDGTRDEYGSDDWEFAARAFNGGAVLLHDPTAVGWHDEPDWADRDGRLDAQNRQSLWLAGSVAEPATRGHVWQPRADTVVRVTDLDGATVGQVVATVDSVLAAVPDGAVVLPADLPAAAAAHVAHDPRVRTGQDLATVLASARVLIDLRGPAIWDAEGLRATIDTLRPGGPGELAISHRGRVVATARSCRAVARARRAGRHGVDAGAALERLFGRRSVEAGELGLDPLEHDVDLAGLLAGWWRP
ncbi:MAG: glycosyltransferase [Ilumatobacteraceae bacterium]